MWTIIKEVTGMQKENKKEDIQILDKQANLCIDNKKNCKSV